MKTYNSRKKTGATFTPTKLADFLSKKLLSYSYKKEGLYVLDPACGDGQLLSSIVKNSNNPLRVIGNDINVDYIDITEKRILNSECNVDSVCFINEDFLSDNFQI